MASTLDTFNQRIGAFLEEFLPDKDSPSPSRKIIHDPLWGSNFFNPWEVALIDTPLLQRLRRIHQTGNTFFTYPSSAHNRFTHSLGVATLAERLLNKLRDDLRLAGHNNTQISNRDIYESRLAGILHDVGHCFFSHTSEQILGHLKEFHDLVDELPALQKKKLPPHEIFAYLIITHPRFIYFWEKIKIGIMREEDRPDLNSVALMIIGQDTTPEKRFLREIITGPYDVDKLEYLYRDAYNAGLKIAYDIERYFYRITIEDTSRYSKKDGEMRLVMDLAGVTAVEQLIFSKMMLFSYIYHHQKVRSADCLVRDIVTHLLTEDDLPIRIEHPCDFLRYTDFDLFSFWAKSGNSDFADLIRRLQNRELLKRCFIVCKDYIEGGRADDDIASSYERLCHDMRDVMKKQREMREEILEKINERSKIKCRLEDIYVDLPDIPAISEAAKAPIKRPDGIIEPISDYFQLEGWQKVYEIKKLRGYFFAKPELVSDANKVIIDLLSEKYGLVFSSLSSQLAKIMD